MSDRNKQDAWLMTALDVPMEVVVGAADQSSEQDRVGGLVWEGASLRAQSALRQLAAEMDRRGGSDYQKAAAMVRSAQEKLAQPLDSAKSVAQMKSWILSESPRVSRRLNTLRGLSHEQVEQVLTRGA